MTVPLPCHLIDKSVLREPCFKGHPKITGVIEPVDRLPKDLYWSGCRNAPNGLSEEHRGALRDIDGDPPFNSLMRRHVDDIETE